MLKTIFGKASDPVEIKKSPLASASRSGVDLDRLKTLIEYYPIGKKLRYYPEYQKEIILDTVIVAYCFNGNFVYSGESIDRNAQGYPTVVRTEGTEQLIPVSELKTFQLLVPDTSTLEMKLDYQRRALIGRGRQFVTGNSISLMTIASGKGASTLDTEVVKKVILQDGPYAQTDMILLAPQFSTLMVTDQRKKSRTKISVPVTLALQKEKLTGLYTIIDMSEDTIRVRVRERNMLMPAISKGDKVILEVDLAVAEQHYTIKGTVIVSRSQDSCVIQLEELLVDGVFGRFNPLDSLELKAGLLNYG